MKKSKFILFFGLLGMLLTGCGNPATSSETGQQTTTSDQPTITETSTTSDVKVESVEITGYTSLDVYGTTKIKLSALVNGGSKLKVSWESSDTSVARVKNGTVTFEQVSETKTVKIKAISNDDKTKFDEVTFNVKHSIFNFNSSLGSITQKENIETDGVHADPADTSIMVSDIYGSRWYVQGSFTFNNKWVTGDPYPKVGIMAGTNENGIWNLYVDDEHYDKNAFYCIYADVNKMDSEFNEFGVVGQNDIHNDWNWACLTHFKPTTGVETGVPYTIGLLRNGKDLYCYAMNEGKVVYQSHAYWEDIGVDEPTYASFTSWGVGWDLSNIIVLKDDEINSMFEQPKDISFSKESVKLYIGDSFNTNILSSTAVFDRSQIVYTSNDEDIATIDQQGRIFTHSVGKTKVQAKVGNLTAYMEVEVTDDPFFHVVVDGSMDDAIYTDIVKTNRFCLLKDDKNYIDFYTTRNDLGVYLFADYYVEKIKQDGGEWWQVDNFEFKLGNLESPLLNNQIWVTVNGGGGANNQVNQIAVRGPYESENGLQNFKFELYMSYDNLNATLNGINASEDSTILFGVGFNPAAGWKEYFNSSGNAQQRLYMTKEGFGRYSDSGLIYCLNGHIWDNNFVTMKEVTCLEDGYSAEHCSFCHIINEETIKVQKSKGEHVYDPHNKDNVIEVISKSTCNTHGRAIVKCSYCDHIEEIDLPVDLGNHEGHKNTDKSEEKLAEVINPKVSRFNEGGWDDFSKMAKLGNMYGDFNLIVKLTHKSSGTGAWNERNYKTVLPLIYDGNKADFATADRAVFRLDWYGWMDDMDGDGLKIANQQYNSSSDDYWRNDQQCFDIWNDSTIEINFKRIGNKLDLWYELTSNIGSFAGVTFEYHQYLNGLRTDRLGLALSCEYTDFEVTTMKYCGGK